MLPKRPISIMHLTSQKFFFSSLVFSFLSLYQVSAIVFLVKKEKIKFLISHSEEPSISQRFPNSIVQDGTDHHGSWWNRKRCLLEMRRYSSSNENSPGRLYHFLKLFFFLHSANENACCNIPALYLFQG